MFNIFSTILLMNTLPTSFAETNQPAAGIICKQTKQIQLIIDTDNLAVYVGSNGKLSEPTPITSILPTYIETFPATFETEYGLPQGWILMTTFKQNKEIGKASLQFNGATFKDFTQCRRVDDVFVNYSSTN